jgi:hypothetical protein
MFSHLDFVSHHQSPVLPRPMVSQSGAPLADGPPVRANANQ